MAIQNKKQAFGFLIAALVLASAAHAEESVVGCCTNPGAGDFVCLVERLTMRDTECCPTPESDYPSYYQSDENPYAPTDYSDCVANFFYENEACDSVSDCATGCCCEPTQKTIKTKAECKGADVQFYEGQSCEYVCILPECSDGIDNDGNGCADSEDTGCGDPYDPTDDSEAGGICRSAIPPGCDSTSYVPELSSLTISPTKGERKMNLMWSDECTDGTTYNIYRCEGANCTDFVLIGTSSSTSFTDENELLFDTDYTYKIEAHYAIQTAKPTIQGIGNLGDLECWHRQDTSNFCIYASYYDQYRNYLIANYDDFTASNFNEQVSKTFGSKFNTPYFCNFANSLIVSGDNCGDKICIVKNNEALCIDQPECNDASANPFGLYATKESCESNYCFYDRSFSIADGCFACSPSMSCYDYKSRESCEEDACGIGNGNCEWRSLSDELGIGVCVNKNTYNCEWCAATGTLGIATNKVTSVVFEGCTEEKAEKLSVEGYGCYFTDGIVKSCADVTCNDYGSDGCSVTRITLDDSNNIANPSNDFCNIGVCELFGEECKKNADGDAEADCTTQECELDYFKPETTITPIIERGIYKSLLIQILDQSNPAGAKTIRTDHSYKTYLCNGCSGSHPFDASTTSYRLVISNLKVFDTSTGEVLLQLNEGTNTIRYYSEDPSKNVGIVKSLSIVAHTNTTGPIIYKVTVTDANEVEGTYYTSNTNPEIKVEFYEPVYITYIRLVNNENLQAITPAYDDALAKEFIFTFPNGLESGDYSFELNAKNENSIYMDNTYVLHLVIDLSSINVTIEPGEDEVINESDVPIRLAFNKEVFLEEVLINGEDFTSSFASGDSIVFTATLNLSDGNKLIEIKAKDYATNEFSTTSSFIVNAEPLSIKIKQPSYGISPTYTFDIIVETDNNAWCKYSFNTPLEYEFMDDFDISGGIEHTITSFNAIPDGSTQEYDLYVACEDELYGVANEVFKLKVDTAPPIIETAYAYPETIVEEPLETQLKLSTNEKTICKYSESQTEYELMENKFFGFDDGEAGFRTVHMQNISSLPYSGNFTYYVACEDMAGWPSETATISFGVDLSAPLIMTDHTPKYSDTNAISLSIETNKKAQCKYSSTDSSVESGTAFGPAGYSHVKTLSLAPGSYEYYVKCKYAISCGADCTEYVWSDVLQVDFTIDTTPPAMLDVDDSSTLSNPEVTWMTDRLRVKWLAEENDTEIHHYLYTLEEFGTLNTVVNWTISNAEDKWIWVTDLNLSDGMEYYFRVKAKNIVGLESDAMDSDGITVDIASKPTSCTNGVKDNNESSIDCGGACEPCDDGKTCNNDIDCVSGYCESGICKTPTCTDGIKQPSNGETGIDCGGDNCPACDDGESCNKNSDCKSNYCSFGVCASDTCFDGKLSGSEGDVDCGGACPTKCEEGKSCNADPDCITGARCVGGICTICADDDLDCNGIPDDQENDQDGDGIDDDWELEHGLDPDDSTDADEDADGDGMTNLEEYLYYKRTGKEINPNKQDTDGDGYNDGVEVRKYETDPTNKNSKPKSKFWLVLLILIGGLLAGSLIFVVYHRIALKKKIEVKPTKPIPRFVPRPVRPIRRDTIAAQIRRGILVQQKREMEKKEERKKVFEAFEKEGKTAKPSRPSTKADEKTKKEKPQKKKAKDAFAKLSEIATGEPAEKKRKKGKTKKEEPFRRLKKLVREKKKK
jgi:hypothetical protein